MHARLTEEFELDGYRPGAPSAAAASIDWAVCEESECNHCGAPAPRYRPYYNPRERVYRAFAVCEKCGHVEEF